MTSISHALIGAAIAAKVPDPTLAATIAFGTHFVCDAIPHWDWGTNWRLRPRAVTGFLAITETFVALVGTFMLFYKLVNPMVLAIAIFFSLIPDWLEAPYYLLMPKSPKIFYYLYKAQSLIHERLDAPWGVITQITVVFAFLFVGFVWK